MRQFFTASLLAALLFSAAAFGAEQEKIVLVAGGAYSVKVPGGWIADDNAQYQAVMLSDKADSECALTLAAPNPIMHSGQLIAMELASLSRDGVDAEIIEGVMDKKDGMTRLRVHFAAPLDDSEALVGLMHLVTVDGCAVMMIATAPDSAFDAFIQEAEAVMDSIIVEPAAIAENREEYADVGRALKEDTIKELLGDNYGKPEMLKQILDYIDSLEPFDMPEEEVLEKAG